MGGLQSDRSNLIISAYCIPEMMETDSASPDMKINVVAVCGSGAITSKH